MPKDKLLTPPEVAEILRCNAQTLADWRSDGRHQELCAAVRKRGNRVFCLESLVLKFAGLDG